MDGIIQKWITDYCLGEITREDFERLQLWMRENDKNQKVFESYLRVHKESREVAFLVRLDKEKSWKQISGRLQKSRYLSFSFYRRMAVVASVFLVLGIGMYYFISSSPTRVPENFSVNIQPGDLKATLIMASGEEIALNRGRFLNVVEKDGTEIYQDSSTALVYEGIADDRHGMSGAEEAAPFNTIRVPLGGEFHLTLADGTRVWLNSQSELRFPTRFNGEKREVYMEGEVYLEVKRDEERPFIVYAGETEIRVLGTSFNVKAYAEEGEVVTTLLSGKVSVGVGERSTKLDPGKQAIWNRKEDRISVREVDASRYISWTKGVFEFEDLSLAEITLQLSRWYDIQFVFEDEDCAERRFTGGVKRYAPLVNFLEIMEQTTNVKFEYAGKNIVIKSH
ncbi:FecR family protein [Gabonibacter massiliensis]|uniref:FecR family protein n=1 Tax=Gabonibacter massiliensis TaxID=1720195 RepID=UPI000AC0428E|nr:FecR domain-containing protein [Gabonibacter massiliensis]